jgi:Glycosyltransferase sugar-binding region containing DXD motif
MNCLQGYRKWVSRADALQVFLLHHYGGLYLDLDIECLRDGTDMLKDWALVLQVWSSAHLPGCKDAAVRQCSTACIVLAAVILLAKILYHVCRAQRCMKA